MISSFNAPPSKCVWKGFSYCIYMICARSSLDTIINGKEPVRKWYRRKCIVCGKSEYLLKYEFNETKQSFVYIYKFIVRIIYMHTRSWYEIIAALQTKVCIVFSFPISAKRISGRAMEKSENTGNKFHLLCWEAKCVKLIALTPNPL